MVCWVIRAENGSLPICLMCRMIERNDSLWHYSKYVLQFKGIYDILSKTGNIESGLPLNKGSID